MRSWCKATAAVTALVREPLHERFTKADVYTQRLLVGYRTLRARQTLREHKTIMYVVRIKLNSFWYNTVQIHVVVNEIKHVEIM